MFGTDYKREMDALEPSRAAMDRLEALTKGEAEVKQVRRFGRRAVVALALCAALAVSAVAAGTGIWQSSGNRHLAEYFRQAGPLFPDCPDHSRRPMHRPGH